MELTDINTVLQIINTAGIAGVLLWVVFLFLKGDIINKGMLDRILDVYDQRLEDLTTRILTRLEEVLREHRE